MLKKISALIMALIIMVAGVLFVGCNVDTAGRPFGGYPNGNGEAGGGSGSGGSSDGTSQEEYLDDNDVEDIEVTDGNHTYALYSAEDGTFVYKCTDGDCDEEVSFTVTCESGTADCYTVDGGTLTFGNITAKSVYSITGKLYGNIVIDVGEDYKFELSLQNFSLTSYTECPIDIESGDKVTISAKNGTENYIYDLREAVDEEGISASVYAKCDLAIQGKGTLYVKSVNNNGIHTKDDLSVKNLTLQVDCIDNALKGNDSVTIESGNLTLIARGGDGIKTSNSDVSATTSKQRGTITISGGNILIYAACDGIDAAYDAVINESTASVDLKIYTDKYSKYSEEVTSVTDSVYYVRYNSSAYKYSVKFIKEDGTYVWCNSSSYKTVSGGRDTYYYYPITKPSGYTKVQLYIYSSAQAQGQDTDYTACTDAITANTNYDTIYLSNRNGSLVYGWTNYTTTTSNMPGGMGGMQEGNTDKGDYSTKGIKADNAINISAGAIVIQSYDDAVHANSDVELENGETPLGNVTVSGGSLTLYSNDDGIHADGTLIISDGTVSVINSYEGLEGNFVKIEGGNVSVISKDDGINATSVSGEAIVISGGNLYVYAGGDGLDSNSKANYDGLLISGGKTVVISTSGGNSCIDSEYGYKYSGGYVIAICPVGMTQEVERYDKTTGYATTKSNFSVTANNYVTVSGVVTVKMPKSITNAFAIYLGTTSGSITTSSSTTSTLDANGVCWNV